MKTVNDFAFYFATFSLQNITSLNAGENIDHGQYPFQPIKFMNLVVPSTCETEPYLSNRPQVSMVYKLINHAGCW